MVWLNDFRWKPSLIPWCELLHAQVLEDDIIHFSAPKNLMSQNIVLDKDTPLFATSDAPTSTYQRLYNRQIQHRDDGGQMAHISIAQANTRKPAEGDKNMHVMFCHSYFEQRHSTS